MSQFAFYAAPDDQVVDLAIKNATPVVKTIELIFKSLPCPRCRTPAPKRSVAERRIFDYGDELQQQPVQIHLRFSRHRCPQCKGKYFYPDTTPIAPPGSRYTHRVIHHAIRLVVEDNLPYRTASWNLWRDHAVFVPFATIQNWVEAAGKKSGKPRHATHVYR